KPREDVHSLALEERINPSLRNWDEFMVARPKKYAIIRNVKETTKDLVNFCFSLEEKAKKEMLSFADYRARDWFLGLVKGGEIITRNYFGKGASLEQEQKEVLRKIKRKLGEEIRRPDEELLEELSFEYEPEINFEEAQFVEVLD
ncbi:7859_t:CDS:2, partial [Funneliformis geosporum]